MNDPHVNNAYQKRSRWVMCTASERVGVTMLLHTAILQCAGAAERWLNSHIQNSPDIGEGAAVVIGGAVSAAVCLLAFVLPAVFCRAATPREARTNIGLRPSLPVNFEWLFLPSVGAILAISDIGGYLFDLIGVPRGTEADLPSGLAGVAMAIINIVILPALCEELLFRGCIYSALEEHGSGVAVIGSAVLFALMHNSLRALPYTFAAGVIFACLRCSSASILPGVILHLANNFISLLFPLMAARLEPIEARRFLFAAHAAVIFAAVISALIWYLSFKKSRNNNKNTARASCPRGVEFRREPIVHILTPAMVIYIITAAVLTIVSLISS